MGQNGFQGSVVLGLVDGQGAGVSGLTVQTDPASVQLSAGSSVTVLVRVGVGAGMAVGTYALQVQAQGGGVVQRKPLTLVVVASPSFALALSPTSLAVPQGSSGTTTLTVTPQNGFTGTVSLSLAAGQDPVPQGLSLSPQSVQVSGTSPVNQTLNVSALSSTPTGTYRLKVRGTSGSLTKDVDLTVTVSAPSGGGGGGSTSGTVTTPVGQVQVALQGGTFAQGPTAQSVTPPQGFQAPYGGIAFTAQVAPGGTLTVTLTFPQAIPSGATLATLKKYQGNAWREVPGVQFSGRTATYQVVDGGALDADGQANGQVVDPVALLAYAFPDPGTLQITYPPSFGPYESLRQQAHQYCIQQYPSDPQGYRFCLTQLAANPPYVRRGTIPPSKTAPPPSWPATRGGARRS